MMKKLILNFLGSYVPEDGAECEYFKVIFIDFLFVYEN